MLAIPALQTGLRVFALFLLLGDAGRDALTYAAATASPLLDFRPAHQTMTLYPLPIAYLLRRRGCRRGTYVCYCS